MKKAKKPLGRPFVDTDLLKLAISMKIQGSSYQTIKDVTGISKSTINKYQRKQNQENYKFMAYRYEINTRINPRTFSVVLDEIKTSAMGIVVGDVLGLMTYAKKEIELELGINFSDCKFFYIDSLSICEFEWVNNRFVEVDKSQIAA